ncbi:MAG: circadian clock protein KaiC, partial [Deltaproteobacteria bacterium]|nr:circadian clock protein KaiC [Deltaproteobacteria bacterium]
MRKKPNKVVPSTASLPKCPTGIKGFDEITGGGLPKGRPTLIAGSAGSGKTLFSMEFLIRGVLEHGEPGVFLSFEENAGDLAQNVASLGFDLAELSARKKIMIDHVRVERSEFGETGEYDLEGLFIRLSHAIDSIGAKRVVLDTVESLFGGFRNEGILRSELKRLFGWLKEKGVTSVITGERGEKSITRHGLEEYVADCVILLDHRISSQISTRRLRVVKYRGSAHGSNEYPFLIGEQGIFLVPITSVGLDYKVSSERVSSGIPRLDTMLGGKGYYRGSSIFVTGTPGTGKTSIASAFVEGACRRREKCIYFCFEESKDQLFRNMRSIGVDLSRWDSAGLLQIRATRPTFSGLEAHLTEMHQLARDFRPKIIVIDPISNLTEAGEPVEVKSMLARLIDYYKSNGITTLFTSLVIQGGNEDTSGMGISSLMDTWIQLHDIESNGEHNRGLLVLKSRGMSHSNQVREFLLTDTEIRLLNVSLSSGGVLMGSSRAAQAAQEEMEAA